jgi:hypothetical protein
MKESPACPTEIWIWVDAAVRLDLAPDEIRVACHFRLLGKLIDKEEQAHHSTSTTDNCTEFSSSNNSNRFLGEQ